MTQNALPGTLDKPLELPGRSRETPEALQKSSPERPRDLLLFAAIHLYLLILLLFAAVCCCLLLFAAL